MTWQDFNRYAQNAIIPVTSLRWNSYNNERLLKKWMIQWIIRQHKVQRMEHQDPLHYLFQTRTIPQVIFLTIRLNLLNSLKIKIKRLQNHCELNGSSPSSLSGLNFLCVCMAEIRQLIHLERNTHIYIYIFVSFDFKQNKWFVKECNFRIITICLQGAAQANTCRYYVDTCNSLVV